MAIRVALRSTGAKKDTPRQIQVIYSFTHPATGKTAKKIVGLKYRVTKADFNFDGKRITDNGIKNATTKWVRRSHIHARKINEEIERIISNLSASEDEIKEQNKIVTPNNIVRSYLVKAARQTPIELFKAYMDYAKVKKKSESTVRVRRSVLKTLYKYQDVYAEELTFDSFNAKFGEQYVFSMAKGMISDVERNIHHKTIGIYMSVIGSFLKWCRKKFGIWDDEKGWAMAMEFANELERDSKEPIPLYKEEIDALWNVSTFRLTPKDILVRDAFILAYETGRRIGEVAGIKTASIHEFEDSGKQRWYINFIARKNKKQIPVLLSDRALEIVMKYHKDGEELLFVSFPIMKRSNANLRKVAKISGLNRKVIQTINAGLEKREEEFYLHEILSYHDGRHTWSNENLMAGMPVELVSKMLTHSNLDTTNTYANRLPAMMLKQQLDWEKGKEPATETDLKARIAELEATILQLTSK